MKFNLKGFLLGAWELIVFWAQLQFMIMCFTSFVLVLMLSLMWLTNEGADTTDLARAMAYAIFTQVAYIFILIVNKVVLLLKNARN